LATSVLALVIGTCVSTYFAVQAIYHANVATAESTKSARRLYISEMRQVQQAWADSNLPLVNHLLSSQLPENTGGKDYRGFEWYYWHRLLHDHSYVLDLGMEASPSMAFNAAGTLLAVAYADGHFGIWNYLTGEYRDYSTSQSSSGVTCLAFKPAGDCVAL